MNLDVFFLFFNCAVTTLLAAAIVIWILRREYLPVIRRLEREGRTPSSSLEGRGTSTPPSSGNEK